MPRKLFHYLRNERRANALTQSDVAALLDTEWRSRVSRYERNRALPPLKTALAYEYIFGKPGSQLFEPIYEQVVDEVKTRARHLLAHLAPEKTALERRRRESLERIAAS